MSPIDMRSAEGTEFVVDTGAPCLDLLYTGGEGERARWEALHAPGDLARWVATHLLGRAVAAAAVDVTAEDLIRAKELREVLWRTANRSADGDGPAAADSAALDAAAARPDIAPQLRPPGVVTPVTGSQVLSTLARDAIGLLTGPYAERIKRCAADDCAIVFADTSRAGTRRWCSMARCGNRDKVRAHRMKEK
ncbi:MULTISPECIES: CGNR zinc finger domain-containing protein [unclassified Rhodococcus (in: high G+C Gram-positive bacteria)]|uniref:CGNR zinc finger domain-containing protein n=1 Tax=unclassified Rhodococcus (in: high G+C Gram-positive bacteria) TaxID=192944 RepID=UPI00197EF00E|nr:CGNR zinc finger domain-containing protein [Rhodococcus sp. M8]